MNVCLKSEHFYSSLHMKHEVLIFNISIFIQEMEGQNFTFDKDKKSEIISQFKI